MLADVSFSTEALAVIAALLGAMATTVAFLYRNLDSNWRTQAEKAEKAFADEKIETEKRLKALEEERDSWRQISVESVLDLQKVANRARMQTGRHPFTPMEPVVPEHNSPATDEQKATADLATVRAALVAVTKDLGLETRLEKEMEAGRAVVRQKTLEEIAAELSMKTVPEDSELLIIAEKAEVVVEKAQEVADKLVLSKAKDLPTVKKAIEVVGKAQEVADDLVDAAKKETQQEEEEKPT